MSLEYQTQLKPNLGHMLPMLEYFEHFVFTHQESFAKYFFNYSIELVHVSFASTHVKIIYVLDSGQHISDSIKMNDFILWLREQGEFI